MRELPKCFHCGASMAEYTHRLSKSLAIALYRFWKVAGDEPMNLKVAGLTRNQWDNFQKLRYWGLVQQEPPGKSGVWKITTPGRHFLSGDISMPRRVVTYRGSRIHYDNTADRVTFKTAVGTWDDRDWYLDQAS